MQLAISLPDGSQMRVLGELSVEPGEDHRLYPRQLEWLPDGSGVTFRARGSKWRVPVQR